MLFLCYHITYNIYVLVFIRYLFKLNYNWLMRHVLEGQFNDEVNFFMIVIMYNNSIN